MPYAELSARSNYSFLEGASHPSELLEACTAAGVDHLALVDRDGVYGAVEAHKAGSGPVCILCTAVSLPLRLSRAWSCWWRIPGWGNLCRLITHARAQAPKGHARDRTTRGRACVGSALHAPTGLGNRSRRSHASVGERLGVMWSRDLTSADKWRWSWSKKLLRAFDAPILASNDVCFHEPSVAARRHFDPFGAEPHWARRGVPAGNGERYVLTEAQLADGIRHVLRRSRPQESGLGGTFSLDALRYDYPSEVVPSGWTPMSWLRHWSCVVWRHASRRVCRPAY